MVTVFIEIEDTFLGDNCHPFNLHNYRGWQLGQGPMQTVGAFAVIFDSGANVLLCHRTDRDAWNLLGGRVEPGETPQETVVREVLEEVGLQVRVERLLGVHPVPAKHDLVFTFLCVPVGGVLGTSSESDRVAWFSRAGLPANTLPRHLERTEGAYEGRAR